MRDEFVSIIVPVYNEERRIEKSLIKILDYCDNNFKRYEVIVVDDGSNDSTFNIISRYLGKILILRNKINMGKGYSVKKGILKSKGDLILFTDSDLSTPIEEINKFIDLSKHYDIVIGSRALKESIVKTTLSKKILGRIGSFFISFIVKDISDTQCGFKLFKSCCKKIFKKQRINRWGFDFEILYIAKKYKLNIKEVPVRWHINKESKVKLLDYPKTFIELIKIKINDLRGLYD